MARGTAAISSDRGLERLARGAAHLAPGGARRARISAHFPRPPEGPWFFAVCHFYFYFWLLGAVPGYAQGAQNTPNRHSIFSIGGTVRDETTTARWKIFKWF